LATRIQKAESDAPKARTRRNNLLQKESMMGIGVVTGLELQAFQDYQHGT
jgi:hypothetical protein